MHFGFLGDLAGIAVITLLGYGIDYVATITSVGTSVKGS